MARYFNFFPKTLYSANNQVSSLDTITNITARFSFERTLKENSSIFYSYDIKDGDTPEIIARKFYDNSERHWIVLLFNDMIDPQFDWPMDERTLNEFIDAKYNYHYNFYRTNINYLSTRILQASVNTPIISSLLTETINGRMLADITNDSSVSSADALRMNNYANNGFANSSNILQEDTYIRDVLIPTIQSDHIKYSSLYGSPDYISNTNTDLIIFNDSTANLTFQSGRGLVWAKTKLHSFYKVITETTSNKTSIRKIEVDVKTYANDTIMQTGTNQSYQLGDNTSVNITINKETKTYFDYELEENEKKRSIKLVKPEFIPGIEKEFKKVIKG